MPEHPEHPEHQNARHSAYEDFVELPPQHPGQANVVCIGWWRGHRVAIRTARQQDGSLNEFYIGARQLFGLHMQVPYHYLNIYAVLRVHSRLEIPKLYSLFPHRPTAYQPTHAFVDGRAATTFDELSVAGAKAYGRHLAAIHSVQVSSAGMVGTPLHRRNFISAWRKPSRPLPATKRSKWTIKRGRPRSIPPKRCADNRLWRQNSRRSCSTKTRHSTSFGTVNSRT